MYAFYTPFDAWWFLRLLLPAWPALCMGTAALIAAASHFAGTRAERSGGRADRLGIYTALLATWLQVFPAPIRILSRVACYRRSLPV